VKRGRAKLWEKYKLSVFENMVPGRIFCEKDVGKGILPDVTKGGREFQNERLHEMFSSPIILKKHQIKEDELGESCNTHEREERKCFLWTNS
jgi:hypothetical protein